MSTMVKVETDVGGKQEKDKWQQDLGWARAHGGKNGIKH